jgi:UDP-glucuronate 4-epimerase
MRRNFIYNDNIVAGVVACLDNPPVADGAAKAGGSIGPHRICNNRDSRSENLAR